MILVKKNQRYEVHLKGKGERREAAKGRGKDGNLRKA
jgi:hypothetical protein